MKKKSAREIPDFSRHPTHASEGKVSVRGAAKPDHPHVPRTVPKPSTKSPNAGRRGQ